MSKKVKEQKNNFKERTKKQLTLWHSRSFFASRKTNRADSVALMFVSRFATNEPNRLCGTTESVQLLGPPLFRQVAQARHHRRRRQQSPSSGSRPVHSVTVPLALDHLRGGLKTGRVRRPYSLKKPLFDRLFCVLALFSCVELLQKSAVKKKRQTDRHRTGLGPIRRPAGPGFGPRKRLSARK